MFKFLTKKVSVYLLIISLLICLLGGILIGNTLEERDIFILDVNAKKEAGVVKNKQEEIPEYLTKDLDFALFWVLWDKIQTKFIDRPVNETELFYGAMSGLVSALDDPYSIFLPPEPAKEFQADLSGEIEGIGAEVGMRDGLITIVSPLPESPAEKAGLQAKDRIIEIDGESTEDMSLTQAIYKIRGKKGTKVFIKVYRESTNSFHEVQIVRETIKIVSVISEIKENNIAYIRITDFNSDTDARFKKAVQEILLANPKGIILDLRSNPGGYLDQSVTIASYWIPSGNVVVSEEFADKTADKYLAEGKAELKDIPTIVLINGGSASASEIVAGALRDYGKAELVGTNTFGKGSVQQLDKLSDGSAVKLTIARWLTPNNSQIDVVGLAPDVEVELTDEDYKNGIDPQLDKAIELLNE